MTPVEFKVKYDSRQSPTVVLRRSFVCQQVPGVRYLPQPTGTSCLSTRRVVTCPETKATPTESPSHGAERPQQVNNQRKHVQFGGLHWDHKAPTIESPKGFFRCVPNKRDSCG